MAGLIIEQRNSDKVKDSEELESNNSSEEHAKALIDAVKASDSVAVASILKAIFQSFDAEPHAEGKHIEPHSYQAQNIKAENK